MKKFIGRKKEIEQLKSLYGKSTSSLVVIKGRRRTGKSTLIQEFAKGKKLFKFTALPPTTEITAQMQRQEFADKLSQEFNFPKLVASDWYELFQALAKEIAHKEYIIAFDEISWMGSEDPTFLGKLKNAWDLLFKDNKKIIFILCGSVSTWIEKNIIKSTGFFGRISLYITLKELSLAESKEFLENYGFKGNDYEVLKILSITGGIPWYLEQVRGNLSADANIQHLCFDKSGVLVNEFDLIFNDLFSTNNLTYRNIVELLSSQQLDFNDIVQKLGYAKSGVLSEYLSNLIEAGFLTRDFTWSLKTKKKSALSHFRLSDNYLRFYLRYIAKNKQKILNDTFNTLPISTTPGWDAFIGLQFENLVLKNRRQIIDLLKIDPNTIICDNPFFQRKTAITKGCQIDYLIQTKYNMLYACEIKFSTNPIGQKTADEVKEKIQRLSIPRGYGVCPVLIHVNGVSDSVYASEYFGNIIDFTALLSA